MLRAPKKLPLGGDPRAEYTWSMVKLARLGDVAASMSRVEIFDAVCDAVAKPLALAAAVMVEAVEGRPRVSSWCADASAAAEIEHGAWRAWSCFVTLVAPTWQAEPLTAAQEPPAVSKLEWRVEPIGDPTCGFVEFGARRVFDRIDSGLLRCAGNRLALALAQARPSQRGVG
jgi:hypothetical protein